MAVREDFLGDYRIGDRVTVVLGGKLIWTGILDEMGEHRIRLRMEDGTIRSVSYNAILADYAPAGPRDRKERDAQVMQEAARQVQEAVYAWQFNPDSLREEIRLSPNSEQKRMVTALCEELAAAADAEDYDTIDKIIAAAEGLAEQGTESAALRRLTGEAALLAEDYETAEESLYNAGRYGEAFYAASMIPSEDRMAEDGACHLLYDRRKQPEVVESFVRLAAEAGDLSVFRRFLEDEGRDYPQLVTRCLCFLAVRKKQYPAFGKDGLYSPSGRSALLKIFREQYPDPENSQLEQMEQLDDTAENRSGEGATFNGESLPDDAGEKGKEGVVFSYKPEHKIGFIRADGNDWFFHLNHIADEQLARMLEEDPGQRYLVTFDVGYNSRGRCATAVRLRDPEHPVEAPDPLLAFEHHGNLTRYYSFYQNGQVTETLDGEVHVYNFRLSYVTDPELKNACELHSDIAQQALPVTFWLKKLKDGKLVASDVQLDRQALQAKQPPEEGGQPEPASETPAPPEAPEADGTPEPDTDKPEAEPEKQE